MHLLPLQILIVLCSRLSILLLIAENKLMDRLLFQQVYLRLHATGSYHLVELFLRAFLNSTPVALYL